MSAHLHHTIIPTRDKATSAAYLADILELPPPTADGWFSVVRLDDDVVINYADAPADFPPLHFAFMIDHDHFDRLLDRFSADGTTWWADPQQRRPHQTGVIDGIPDGRRMYFLGPERHYYEVITHRYVASP